MRIRQTRDDALMSPVSSPVEFGMLRNRTFDEIAIGDAESIQRTLTVQDIRLYAVLSGDENPQQLDSQVATSTHSHGVIAHGMWAGALVAGLIGERLPGPGTRYLGQSLKFLASVRIGDTLTISVTVTRRDAGDRRVWLACRGVDQDGRAVIEGEAEVIAPDDRIECPRATLPVAAERGSRRPAAPARSCATTRGNMSPWFIPAMRSVFRARATHVRPA